jgi:NAD-dependent dihydropyrimidine dehydrogenase PreA subunit
MSQRNSILYCNCGHYELVPELVKARIVDALAQADVQFEAVQDLCGLAARKDPQMKRWAEIDGLRIIACFPRTIKWLFIAGGAPLGEDVEVVNLRSENVEKIVALLKSGEQRSHCCKDAKPGEKGDWIPWFPVIDYDRCKNCSQCLNFCLFGVYELSQDGKVEVVKPANCKTNCPACARACPERAIIFPKYGQSPINGDQVEESDNGSKTRVDLSELTDGDILKKIRRRSKGGKRFAKDRDSRRGSTNVQELRKKLDIPAEVLASLSPADMARLREKSAGQDRGKEGEQDS